MASPLTAFSESDLRRLYELLSLVKNDQINTRFAQPVISNTVYLDSTEGKSIYVAKTPTAGIDKAELRPPNLKPGIAECDIYYFSEEAGTGTDDGLYVLADSNTERVHNISFIDIPGDIWVVISKDKYGSWIATGFATVDDTGTATGTLEVGCGLTIDNNGEIVLDLTDVAIEGLEWNAELCTLYPLLGCGLMLEGIAGSDYIVVDVEQLTGERSETGLIPYEDTGTGSDDPCLEIGIDLEVDETKRFPRVKSTTLEVPSGDMPIIRLSAISRDLAFDENQAGVLIGVYESGTGTTTNNNITFVDSQNIDFQGNTAGNTITAEVIYQMSVDSAAGGLKLKNDRLLPAPKFYYGTNKLGVKGWYALISTGTGTDDDTVEVDCGLDIDLQGRIVVDYDTLVFPTNETGLTVYSGDVCDAIAVDLTPVTITTETLLNDVTISRAGNRIALTKVRTTYTNYFNAAGLPVGRTGSLPVVVSQYLNICDCTGTGTGTADTSADCTGTGTPCEYWHCLTHSVFGTYLCLQLTFNELEGMIASGWDWINGYWEQQGSCSLCCEPITGWDGAGWYCIFNPGTSTSTACIVEFLFESDMCDTNIEICSGAYATELEALIACGDTGTGTATSTCGGHAGACGIYSNAGPVNAPLANDSQVTIAVEDLCIIGDFTIYATFQASAVTSEGPQLTMESGASIIAFDWFSGNFRIFGGGIITVGSTLPLNEPITFKYVRIGNNFYGKITSATLGTVTIGPHSFPLPMVDRITFGGGLASQGDHIVITNMCIEYGATFP